MAQINKKTNEAWFGDSFNRGSINAYVSPSDEVCFSTSDCSINSSALTELAGHVTTANCVTGNNSTTYTVAKGCTISAVDTLSDQLDEIKARLSALEETITIKQKNIRSGLKTLNYKREVE